MNSLIQEVLDLINREEVMAVRKRAERQHASRNQPTCDPIVPPRRKKQTRKKRPKTKPRKIALSY
jgi:hypothetical protein